MNNTYERMAELIREQILFEAAVDEGVRDVLRRGAFGAGLLASPLAGQGEVQGPPTKPGASKEVTQTEPGSDAMRKVWGVKAKHTPPGTSGSKLQGPPTHKTDFERRIRQSINTEKAATTAKKAAAEAEAAKKKADWTLPSQRKK